MPSELTVHQRHYRRNRERRIEESKRRAERSRRIIRIAKSVPCADCGQEYAAFQMDFDHVRGDKTTNVGVMLTYSEARLREEIVKCEVRCANCHRWRHVMEQYLSDPNLPSI